MKKEVYYRFQHGNKSIFSKIARLYNQETDKRYSKAWAKEYGEWSEKENRNIGWLAEPELEKGAKFYFTKVGKDKYKKTLFVVHKEMLNPKKTPFRMNKKILNSKKLKIVQKICFRKLINNGKILYDFKTKRKIGKIIYEDKYQIAVK